MKSVVLALTSTRDVSWGVVLLLELKFEEPFMPAFLELISPVGSGFESKT